MTKADRPWSVTELAKEAGVDGSRLRQLLIAGEIEGAYKLGKTWAIPRDIGDKWLAERKTKWSKF